MDSLDRSALVNEHTWNPPLVSPAVPPDPNDRVGYSAEIWAGRFDDVDEVIKPIYEEASQAVGRKFKYPKRD
jgi:ribonuclease Z